MDKIFFYIQHFLIKNFSARKNFFRPKIILHSKVFFTQIFFDPTLFRPKILSDLKIFRTKSSFGPKSFLDPSFFLTQYFFGPEMEYGASTASMLAEGIWQIVEGFVEVPGNL